MISGVSGVSGVIGVAGVIGVGGLRWSWRWRQGGSRYEISGREKAVGNEGDGFNRGGS